PAAGACRKIDLNYGVSWRTREAPGRACSAMIEGSNVHRAIPPDSAHARLPQREGEQHEAVGDLHFAADNFVGAVEAYAAALAGAADWPAEDRLRLLLRLARCHYLRGEFQLSITTLADARFVARTIGTSDANARVAAQLARSWTELGEYTRGQRYARYAYRVLRNGDDHRSVGEVGVALGLCCTRLGRNAEALRGGQHAAPTL